MNVELITRCLYSARFHLSGVWKKTEIKGCKIIDYVNCISSVVTNSLGGCFGLVEIMSKESYF